MSSSVLIEVFSEVVEMLIDTRGHLLTDLQEGLLRERDEIYANAITGKGSPLESFVGFIDCSKIEMARPGEHGSLQRSCYSGHKRIYCQIY